MSVPLLKFPLPERKAHLQEAGLNAIRALQAPVHVVTITGDARCGKSSIGNAVTGDRTAFEARAGPQSVTEGIDACIVPYPTGGHLVLLDCEGSNSPLAPVSVAVDVLGMLCSSLTVQVVWGQLGNHQLDQLGSSLAHKDILPREQRSSIMHMPAQKLLLVPNADHLGYGPGDLDRILDGDHAHAAGPRGEVRAKIKESFSSIRLISVPHQPTNDWNRFTEVVEPLKQAIVQDCDALTVGGVPLCGQQIVELMSITVDYLRNQGVIPVPSIFRYIVYDHFLYPKAQFLLTRFRQELPQLADHEPHLSLYDNRPLILQEFDDETRYTSHVEMVREARSYLESEINEAWGEVELYNTSLGNQTRVTSEELDCRFLRTDERVIKQTRCCLLGPRREVLESVPIFKYVTRTRKVKRNGMLSFTSWIDTGRTTDAEDSRPLPMIASADCVNTTCQQDVTRT